MFFCRKCNSPRVSGPKFCKNTGGEKLAYTCLQCGYVEYRPCHDAKQNKLEEALASNHGN